MRRQRPEFRMLDLCCGCGGASEGYRRAADRLGIDLTIVGVDLVPQPSYPFAFELRNALHVELDGFDFVHGSPPCKRWTVARKVAESQRDTLFDPHPDVLGPLRARLLAWGGPFIIENVPGAPLLDPVVCCGSAFALGVGGAGLRRHRLFESNLELEGSGCEHAQQAEVVGVYGDGGAWTRTAPGGGGRKVVGAEAAEALGIGWTSYQAELAQAIPPAYTEHLGLQAFWRLLRRPD